MVSYDDDGESWPAYKSGAGGGGGPNVSGGGGGIPGGGYGGSSFALRKTVPLSEALAQRRKWAASGYSQSLAPQGQAAPMGGAQPTGGGYGAGVATAPAPASNAPSFLSFQDYVRANNLPMGGAGGIRAQAAYNGYANWYKRMYGQANPGYQAGTAPTISGNGWQGDIGRLVNDAGGQGVFDPNGSQGLIDLVRRNAEQQGQQDQMGALHNARYLAGDDPASAGFASLASSIGSQGHTADAVNNAVLTSRMQNQSRIWDLLDAYLQSRMGNDIAQTQAQGQTDWGSVAGGIGGLIGGVGSLGKKK